MRRLALLVLLITILAGCDEPSTFQGPALGPSTLLASSATITQTLLMAGTSTVNQKVYTTAAIAPAPNTLITVAVLGHRAYGATPSPTVSGGGMTAWTEVATITFDGVGTPLKRHHGRRDDGLDGDGDDHDRRGRHALKRLTIYRAMSAAPGSGPLTITFSGNVSNCQWIVSQWDGVETSGVNGAGAVGQTGSSRGDAVNSLAVTLAAFENPNNVAYGVFGVRSRVLAVTPGAGFAEISEQPSAEWVPSDLEAEWATNLNTIAATWTTLNAGALGVEIKARTIVPDRPHLAAGSFHTCQLTTSGAAYCWGNNLFGQLGNGSTTHGSIPVAVAGGLSFSALAAGRDHTCGLTSSGVAYCWGDFFLASGPLPNGSTTNSSIPVAVSGGLSFEALVTGFWQTCGLTSAGAAYCLGFNDYGQLGDGSTTGSSIPVAVTGGLSFRALAADSGHTCGLTSSGAAYCWGLNNFGQLGNGSTTGSSIPVAVTGGLSFSALAAGSGHTCGLTSSGAAYCWGSNDYGQLGDGSNTTSSIPVAVAGGRSFTALAAGDWHTCGLTSVGAAYCWGENSRGRATGQLGDGSTASSLIPVAVSGGLSFTALAAGDWHTCGLTSVGATYCWGWNALGQLGDGSTTNSWIPVAVSGGLTSALWQQAPTTHAGSPTPGRPTAGATTALASSAAPFTRRCRLRSGRFESARGHPLS